jgi:hypothetical protein
MLSFRGEIYNMSIDNILLDENGEPIAEGFKVERSKIGRK